MNYNDVFLFIRLIKLGTFTALANSMNVSQSTVSRRIQSLEESLNMKLLKRNSRGLVEMTEEGKTLYYSFNEIENHANNASQEILNKSEKVEGLLKIALPKIFFDNVIVDKLDNFYKAHPNVKLVFSYNGGQIDLLKDNLDIAISTKQPINQNCTFKTLITAKNKLFASNDYIKEHGTPNSIAELSQHNIIGTTENNALLNELKATSEKDASIEIVKISPNLYLHNSACDMDIAIHNKVIINTYDILFNESQKVKPILSDYYFGEAKVYLIRGTGIRSNLEKKFVKFVEVCLQQQGI